MVVYFCTLGLILLSFKINRKRLARISVCVFSCILLISIAGLRYYVGTDYGNYLYDYQDTVRGGFSLSLLSQPALPLLALFCNKIGGGYELWFFILSCITIIPVFLVIYKNKDPVFFPIIFYLFLGCWHQSFNVVKQTAAASILFYGYFYICDKKLFRWIICCLIASLFHITAVLMIPVYFLARKRVNFISILIILFVGIIFLFSYDRLFNLAAALKQGTAVVASGSATKENSVNILRVLVQCCPLLLYLIAKRKYKLRDNNNSVLLTLSLINAVLSICAMRSIYLFRFCLYTNIFNVLFISRLLEFIKRRHTLLVAVIILLYFAFWIYDLYKDPATNVYKWILSR